MNKYLVALRTGGVMEQPNIIYENFMIVNAETERDAEIKYNEVNNCYYYYGECIGYYNKENKIILKNYILEKLLGIKDLKEI